MGIKKPEIEIDESSKFPMSSHLNKKRYSLSYDVRMLGCHCFDRLLTSCEDFRELKNLNLWYRCLLQEIIVTKFSQKKEISEKFQIIKDHTGEINPKNVKIGRKLINDSTAPANCFLDYVRKALARLELTEYELSDEDILEFWTKNSHMKFRFDAYIQLKMILSPVIEYIILLDRLIYLHEV